MLTDTKGIRAAWLHWFIVWLAIGAGGAWLHGEKAAHTTGQVLAWGFLASCWDDFLTWAVVTLIMFSFILLAALLGSPFKPWGWFKND